MKLVFNLTLIIISIGLLGLFFADFASTQQAPEVFLPVYAEGSEVVVFLDTVDVEVVFSEGQASLNLIDKNTQFEFESDLYSGFTDSEATDFLESARLKGNYLDGNRFKVEPLDLCFEYQIVFSSDLVRLTSIQCIGERFE